jgi:hypothetical protein
MEMKEYQLPITDELPYPLNLALNVRNFIVLTSREVHGDLATFSKFMAVICDLERQFPDLNDWFVERN